MAVRVEGTREDVSILSPSSVAVPELDKHSHEPLVLVKLTASSINPSDVKNLQGKMVGPQRARTPGRDFAGRACERAR